jgi:hypothetical protein
MTQAPTTGSRPFSRRQTTALGRVATATILLLLSGGLFIAILVRPTLDLPTVAYEDMRLLEVPQAWLWLVVAVLAGMGALRQTHRRGLLLLTWLGVIAVLAGLREMDLHVLLNPEHSHWLGIAPESAVRFRSRWWLEGPAPVTVRFAWAVAFLATGLLLVLPFALARYPWPRQLRRGRRFPWLVVGGFALLACGFLLDDAIGRPLDDAGIVDLSVLEEILELAGELLILVAVALLALGRVDLCIPPHAEAGESAAAGRGSGSGGG